MKGWDKAPWKMLFNSGISDWQHLHTNSYFLKATLGVKLSLAPVCQHKCYVILIY